MQNLSKRRQRSVNAACKARVSSSGSEMGGWQDVPEQMIATVFFAFTAGSSGTVVASTGGRYCATASFVGSLMTDLLKANGTTAAFARSFALASSPTTTTCVCGSENRTAAIP